MEWSVFLISMGMLMSLALIGIGVCVSDVLDKGKLHRCNNCSVLHTGDPDLSDSLVGDTDGSEHSGQDMEPDVPSPEMIETVLNVFRLHACRTEQEVIDYLISKERRQDNE